MATHLSTEQLQEIFDVDSSVAMKTLSEWCPAIAQLDPALIQCRLMRLEVPCFPASCMMPHTTK